MIPYFLLIVLPLIVRVISKKYRITSGHKQLYETRTAALDVFMFLFFLLLALRGLNCGNDTRQYWNLFNRYNASSLVDLVQSGSHELGYKLLNKLIGTTTGSYQVFLFTTAMLCVWPVWYFYKQASENQLLTIALFLTVAPFVMYFSGIRQAIAMSLGVPAWYATKNKKIGAFILAVVFAMQFHTSAIVLFALYPLYYAKITKTWLWFVIPCMVAVYVLRQQIFTFLFTFLWKEYDSITETGAVNVLILLIMFAIYSYVIPDETCLDDDVIAMRNILLLSVVLQIFAMLHPLSMRMNYYFLLFVPILIPKIANRTRVRYSEVAKLSIVVLTIYFIYYFLNNTIRGSDDLNIAPYIPFWENLM